MAGEKRRGAGAGGRQRVRPDGRVREGKVGGSVPGVEKEAETIDENGCDSDSDRNVATLPASKW